MLSIGFRLTVLHLHDTSTTQRLSQRTLQLRCEGFYELEAPWVMAMSHPIKFILIHVLSRHWSEDSLCIPHLMLLSCGGYVGA